MRLNQRGKQAGRAEGKPAVMAAAASDPHSKEARCLRLPGTPSSLGEGAGKKKPMSLTWTCMWGFLGVMYNKRDLRSIFVEVCGSISQGSPEGWGVPRSAHCKQNTQESQPGNLTPVCRPESQGSWWCGSQFMSAAQEPGGLLFKGRRAWMSWQREQSHPSLAFLFYWGFQLIG